MKHDISNRTVEGQVADELWTDLLGRLRDAEKLAKRPKHRPPDVTKKTNVFAEFALRRMQAAHRRGAALRGVKIVFPPAQGKSDSPPSGILVDAFDRRAAGRIVLPGQAEG